MSRPASRESLFHEWQAEHRGIIGKVTRSFAVTPTQFAELQQELLLQLWNSTAGYVGEAKSSTWVYRVCLNTALTWRRGSIRRERRIERDVDLAQLATGAPAPSTRADQSDLLEKLYAAIHAMPDFERALVLLSLDGLAYREIAEITGLTENHVGVALSRARRRLAQLMKGVIDELE
jgi:RNA polymerase sigma-70 factor (ECF subfamily)